jgi:hypothetical protein
MNLSELYNKELEYLYSIANTPSSFYQLLRDSYYVNNTLQKYESRELIGEFYNRALHKIDNAEQLANVYGILVALTFKDEAEVLEFFTSVKDSIKYEWFPHIADFYIKGYTPPIHFQVSNIPVPVQEARENFSIPSN